MATVYEIVTGKIIEQLERGVAPWQKPWHLEAPKNLCSGKAYRGINVLLLGMRGYASPWWLTFQQARERGGHVRKGEHGTLIVFWKWPQQAEATDATDDTRQAAAPLLRYYTTFNSEQCDGIAVPASVPTVNPIETAEAIAASMPNPPTYEQSDKAAYAPARDTVYMPARQSFDTAEGFYSTRFHEMTHSTGHTSRLNRQNVMQISYFGSENYSREELVAEMGAAMLCAVSGIEAQTVHNSAAYIQNWLRVLKGDARMVVMAASQAQKAADYIRGISKADAEEAAQ
jgi:antirestriction protein ArdC